jgi:hypothetical protein
MVGVCVAALIHAEKDHEIVTPNEQRPLGEEPLWCRRAQLPDEAVNSP